MKINPILTDEPSLAPATPGAALARVSSVIGALRRFNQANAMPAGLDGPGWETRLEDSRTGLLQSLEAGTGVQERLTLAQTALRELYAGLVNLDIDADARAKALEKLGFPAVDRDIETWLSPVDVASVVLTHFKPAKQVFSTIAFDESHGATAYWLNEVRYFDGERLEDAVVENYAPQFSRIRLPVGRHRLFIESRNTHRCVRSEEFDIEVP